MAKEIAQDVPVEKFPVEDFLAHSVDMFGVKRHTILGAVHGNEKTEFTVAEMKTLVEDFKKKEVN